VPDFVTEADGQSSVKGTVESFTAIYRRNNEIEHGVVMLRTANNARALARVPARDRQTLAHLLDMDRTPVGSAGDIVTAEDGILEWRVA
jgi:acetyl-CoA C-acetyltransferase